MSENTGLIAVLGYCMLIGIAGWLLFILLERKKGDQPAADGSKCWIADEVMDYKRKWMYEFEREVMETAGELAEKTEDKLVTKEIYEQALLKVIFLRYAKQSRI